MAPSQFRTFLSQTLANGVRVSAESAVHFVCMDWRHIDILIGVGREIYGDMLNLVVWSKSNAGQGSFYRSQHELIGVSLSEIISEHIDGVIRRELALGECSRWPEWREIPAHLCSETDVCERRCNIPYTRGVCGADIVREDNDMIKTFASDGANQPFRVSVLPWRARRGRSVTNPDSAKTPFEYLAIDAVAIANEISRRTLPAASLCELPGDPFGGRMHRHP